MSVELTLLPMIICSVVGAIIEGELGFIFGLILGMFITYVLLMLTSSNKSNSTYSSVKEDRYYGVGESSFYNTDLATGEKIATLKNINEKLGGENKYNAVGESAFYNTDLAEGEIIAQLKNLNDNLKG